VNDSDRRDIHEDVIFNLAKREKEQSKVLKKENMKGLANVLDTMPNITFRTTWQEAQQMLLDNHNFAENSNLLGSLLSLLNGVHLIK
jgi:pre-mRNA-processing factor 40